MTSAELAETRAQLREARETIEAIRGGGVDSLVIGPPGHEQVYVLDSADRPYRLMVEAMSEGAATISPRGVILAANARLGSMTGRTAKELVGMAAVDLADSAHRTRFAQLLDVSAGRSARGEVDLTGPEGMIVPVLLEVSGLDLDGALLRAVILTDLSERRVEIQALTAELETRLADRTADLERANRNLEAFINSVSHDLRAPLRAMSGFSQALVEDYGELLDQTGRGYTANIQAASEQMATLIDNLLHLSRLARAEMHLQPVDLSVEVAAIAAELQAGDPGREVRFAIQDGVRLVADRALIRTVLHNLLENAWKFTARRDGATIEFGTTSTEDAGVCCFVRDNGAGFDPDYADKLFQPFQRLHAVTDFPGTGIGLAGAAGIIQRHRGRVWAHGAVDGGATFYFTLDAK